MGKDRCEQIITYEVTQHVLLYITRSEHTQDERLLHKDLDFVLEVGVVWPRGPQPRTRAHTRWTKEMGDSDLYYSALKIKEILSFAPWINLESIMLSAKGQTERNRYCPVWLLCGI